MIPALLIILQLLAHVTWSSPALQLQPIRAHVHRESVTSFSAWMVGWKGVIWSLHATRSVQNSIRLVHDSFPSHLSQCCFFSTQVIVQMVGSQIQGSILSRECDGD